jgi:tetratricopeptide (TPR) repeat protein
VLLTLLVVFGAGCADMLTFSKDSHRKGVALYEENEYAEAAGAFRNAVRQNPRSYRDYYMLGASYEAMGQYQQAIQAYRQAMDVQNITLEGKYDDEHRIKTITALAGAIAKSDARDIETNQVVAAARTKQSADHYMLLAKIYAFRGDADSAVEAYDHAALLAPQSFPIAKEYGLYLERLGQMQKAQTCLRRAYAMNNQDEQVTTALRRMGVVPGPSLKRQRDLVGPPVPKGPIPEVDWSKMGLGGGQQNQASAPSAAPPAQGGTVQAPRD